LRWTASRPRLGDGAGADGAVVTFLGLVRNHNLGRSVRYLEYEAYEPLALKAFERIAGEVAERWPGARLALHHRIGRCRSARPASRLRRARRIAATPTRPAATPSSA
jgi:molybdopterin synthase catalytic subunit